MKPTNIIYRMFNGRPYAYRLVEPEEPVSEEHDMPDEVWLTDNKSECGYLFGEWQDRRNLNHKHCYVKATPPPLVTWEQMWTDFKKFHSHNRSPGRVDVNANTFHYIREHFSPMKVCVVQAITEISFGMTILDVVINDTLADGQYMFASYEKYGATP